MSKVIGTTFM